jgi:thymidylate kinase
VEERWLCRWLARASVRPDAAFCLVVPPELSLERARGKARFHWETPEVLERRWREYGDASAKLSVQVVDASRPAGEIARTLQRGVAEVLQTLQLHPGR